MPNLVEFCADIADPAAKTRPVTAAEFALRYSCSVQEVFDTARNSNGIVGIFSHFAGADSHFVLNWTQLCNQSSIPGLARDVITAIESRYPRYYTQSGGQVPVQTHPAQVVDSFNFFLNGEDVTARLRHTIVACRTGRWRSQAQTRALVFHPGEEV